MQSLKCSSSNEQVAFATVLIFESILMFIVLVVCFESLNNMPHDTFSSSIRPTQTLKALINV